MSSLSRGQAFWSITRCQKKIPVVLLREWTMTTSTVMRKVLMSLRRLWRGKSYSILPLQSCLSQLHGWHASDEGKIPTLHSLLLFYLLPFLHFALTWSLYSRINISRPLRSQNLCASYFWLLVIWVLKLIPLLHSKLNHSGLRHRLKM